MNHVITGKTISLTGVQEHSVLGWESGEYSFESKAFFPIDTEYPNEAPDFYNQTYTAETVVGHGNQGREQNYHFCSKIHTVHHILPYIVHHVVHHVVRHIVDYMHMHMTCTSACTCHMYAHVHVAFTHGITMLHHNRLSRTTVLANSYSLVTMMSGSSSTIASR